MKTRLILAALALSSLAALGESANECYRNGMSAIARGDSAQAQTSFTRALEIDPNHANARFQLNRLPNIKGEMVAKARANQLSAVKLSAIDFSDVPLSDALMALNQMIVAETTKDEKDKDKAFNPNLMIQDPSGKLADREVTLQLKGISAKVALDYLLEMAGATARYDAHATVIRPANSTAKAGK